MRLRGKLTESEFGEVAQLGPSQKGWLSLVTKNGYGILLISVVLWATISTLRKESHPVWWPFAILWIIIAAIFVWAAYRRKRAVRRQFAKVNGGLPDWITLGEDGVKSEGPRGATGHFPWNSFMGWREGQDVFLLDRLEDKTFLVLPTGDLPEVERETVRGYLRSHVRSANEAFASE